MEHLPSVGEIRAAAVERAELRTRRRREAEQAKREATVRAGAVEKARATENLRLGREFIDLPEPAYVFRVTVRKPEVVSYDARLTLIPVDAPGASFVSFLQIAI